MMLVETGIPSLLFDIFLPPAGQCNQDDSGPPGLTAYGLRRLITIHHGHSDVHNDDVGSELTTSLHGFLAVGRRDHFMT
jgi:hypothetical protein